MRRLGLIAIVLAAGCGDGEGDSITATANGVFPAEGFIGRTVRVEISGDATNWTSGVTVNLGPDVTVQNVKVASPTDLFADITIKGSATAGLTDVTVTDDGEALTLSQAFELKTPIDVSVNGTLAQGSVAFLSIRSHDFDNPFDQTTDADGNFVNTSITGPDGVLFQVNNVTDYTIDAVAFVNVDAAATGPLSVVSGADEQIESPYGALDITARTATEITAGTPATGTLADAVGTALFHFAPGAGPAAITAFATSSNSNANPQLILLAGSGHFEDGFDLFPITDPFFGDILRQGFGQIEATPGAVYPIFFDNSGLTNVPFTIHTNAVALDAGTDEVTVANETAATAQVFAATPVHLTNGELTDEDDLDFITFTVTAADVGKVVHVITNGGAGDPETDTVVEVLGGTTAANAATLGGKSDDAQFGEDWTSAPIKAGTTKIFIKVSASSAFDPGHTTYELAAFLEAAPE